VIDKFDIEELRRANEPTRVRDVFVRWLRVTGGVVVEHDDASAPVESPVRRAAS
jgi:hypothetical protein